MGSVNTQSLSDDRVRSFTSWRPSPGAPWVAWHSVEGVSVREITVFSRFDDAQCSQIAAACHELDVEAGTALTEEGENGFAMFAVLEGTANVSRDGELIRVLEPGDVFGEIAVFYGGRRTATVVASSPMRLLMLFTGELRRLDRELPELADELRKVIAERLDRDGRAALAARDSAAG